MKEIGKWLVQVEGTARRIYEKAASRFSGDVELSRMLRLLEADERRHYSVARIIQELAEGMDEGGAPAISLDAETMDATNAIFEECERRLDAGEMTKEDLISAVINIECSEHNEYFIYAINLTQGRVARFLAESANFGEHKARIERFIETRPEFMKFIEKLRRLPEAAKENLLVVDDEDSMTEAFNALLSEHGVVDVASNGKEALEKLEGKYYAAIISDVKMPVMNGVEFYEKAVKMYPSVKERFIFLTNYGEDYSGFFINNRLRYLEKPALIKDIREAVKSVLNAVSR